MSEIPSKLFDEVFGIAFRNYPLEQTSFKKFLAETINGDTFKSHVAFGATNPNKEDVTILYVLTNIRLIKVVIKGQEVRSYAAFLNQIKGGVNRKITKESAESPDVISLSVNFEGGNFGLTYTAAAESDNITRFFQNVDAAIRVVQQPRNQK
ncbi:MAG: hypothetical protein KGO96_09370 [Elusimicrobia bacterium]|nr:hypothetical protein [Elusimicrobiota bacterium]MDE2426098.1 hypothetical protein [Elusimicrobiota bacterium]